MWLLSINLLCLTWAAWSFIPLLQNYRVARTIGLPIVVSPVSSLNIPWILAYKTVPQILPLLRRLPFGLGQWSRFLYIGWVFDDAGAAHRELGPAFVVCMPSANEVVVADAEAARSVLTRRKDFTKPAIMYDSLNVFGPNLDSVEGATWQRHRRLTAPSLNEKVSSAVWAESLRQASQMLLSWSELGSGGTRETSHDTATLALHVWTKAGFGIQYDFEDPARAPAPPYKQSYRDALLTVLHNFTVLTILPIHWLDLWFMPTTLRDLGQACRDFMLYMKEMVKAEKDASAQRDVEANNLLTMMIRASEDDRRAGKQESQSVGLTDDELYGNIFIFSLAGHETTANAMSCAIVHLAAKPQWQNWLAEEITRVCGADSNPQTWAYEENFPKLKRCLATMFETLRLAGSAPQIPKTTGNESQPLRINSRDYVIPSNTFITVNGQALHCDTQTWGEDAHVWRPDRWLRTSETGEEELIQQAEGSYVPWADGPRVCPGKKFAQVEFVAVLSYLFRSHQVRPVALGMSPEAAQKQTLAMVEDCVINAITLQMRDSRRVPMAWSCR